MIEKQDEDLSILRMLLGATSKATANTDIMLKDIIPSLVDSVDDLNKLSSRLDDDQEFTKKMVSIPTNIVFIIQGEERCTEYICIYIYIYMYIFNSYSANSSRI